MMRLKKLYDLRRGPGWVDVRPGMKDGLDGRMCCGRDVEGAVWPARLARPGCVINLLGSFHRLLLQGVWVGRVQLSGDCEQRTGLRNVLRIPKPACDFADSSDRLAAFGPEQVTEHSSGRKASGVNAFVIDSEFLLHGSHHGVE